MESSHFSRDGTSKAYCLLVVFGMSYQQAVVWLRVQGPVSYFQLLCVLRIAS